MIKKSIYTCRGDMNINLKTIQCLNKQALIAFECDAFPVNQDLAIAPTKI